MSARETILERLRCAERTGHVPASNRAAPPAVPALAGDQLIARFVRELDALGVQTFVESSEQAVRTRVTDLVGARSVFQWNPGQLPYGVGSLFPSAATGASPRSVQAAAELGVTGADAGIAETGSLVVLSGDGKPRAASLLPLVHLAIVRRADLYDSMGAFFASRADAIARAACCTFITGPSRTADIELTLTLGVHGPGVVIVVVGP
jgi:L-lactate dehydrogenase complex protein LldG